MTGLVEWLEAQIAEDERIARAAEDGVDGLRWGAYIVQAKHIARHDPSRVLAECNAKRRIIEAHQPDRRDGFQECTTCIDESDVHNWEPPDHERWPCPTLRALAAVFEGRPGYQETWGQLA